MFKAFQILSDTAAQCSGYVLHGKPVSVKLLSLNTVKRSLDGTALMKAGYSLSVSGKNQSDLLNILDNCRKIILADNCCFNIIFSDVSCSYSDHGEYLYSLEWSCMFFDGGDSL